MYNRIEAEHSSKPPYRSLYQVSPAELQAAKKYLVCLMKKGKIRPSKSQCGAPLLFMKDEDKPFRGVIDYRALDRITKRKIRPSEDLMKCWIDLEEQKCFGNWT
jgi:hypothetical protein